MNLKEPEIPNFELSIIATADDKRLIVIPIDDIDIGQMSLSSGEHISLERRGAYVPDANGLVRRTRGQHTGLVGRPLDVLDRGRVAHQRPLIDVPARLTRLAFETPHVDVLVAVAGGQLAGRLRRPVDGEALGLVARELKHRTHCVVLHELGHGFRVRDGLQCVC